MSTTLSREVNSGKSFWRVRLDPSVEISKKSSGVNILWTIQSQS